MEFSVVYNHNIPVIVAYMFDASWTLSSLTLSPLCLPHSLSVLCACLSNTLCYPQPGQGRHTQKLEDRDPFLDFDTLDTTTTTAVISLLIWNHPSEANTPPTPPKTHEPWSTKIGWEPPPLLCRSAETEYEKGTMRPMRRSGGGAWAHALATVSYTHLTLPTKRIV